MSAVIAVIAEHWLPQIVRAIRIFGAVVLLLDAARH
jgi:hypothetical protein